jgi:hypothetical protein
MQMDGDRRIENSESKIRRRPRPGPYIGAEGLDFTTCPDQYCVNSKDRTSAPDSRAWRAPGSVYSALNCDSASR